jgi:hypothetical protein
MTSFVHTDYSTQHPGVTQAAPASAGQINPQATGTRALSKLLLSAVAAAVMVVAYQVMDSMADGHLLVLWIGLWAVAFATLAICANTARNVARRVKSSLDKWSRTIAAKRADERLWAMAQTDGRVMADLQAVMTRHTADADEEALTFVAPIVAKSDWLKSSAARRGAPALNA